MLTQEQILANKTKYLELLSKLGVDLTTFSKYLDSVDYFNKPASPQYFKSYPGGLCQYALDTYYELGSLANAYFPGRYSQEDIIKVALFRDIYRAEMYEGFQKNVKNDETGQWESVPAYRLKEDRPTYGDLGFSSYMTVNHFFQFTDEQIEAIVQSRPLDNYTNDLHDILKSYPLVTLARMADMAATCFEGENGAAE
jgi:hypothetical protein